MERRHLTTRPNPARSPALPLLVAVFVTCAAWTSAGVEPLTDAAAGALSPSDFPTDFVPAARRAQGLPPGTDVVTGNAEARAAGAPAFVPVGAPYRAHPPPAVMVVRPLVPLGFRGARWCGWRCRCSRRPCWPGS